MFKYVLFYVYEGEGCIYMKSMGLYFRFYMYMCNEWRLYYFDFISDYSGSIGESVWVYVSDYGRECLNVWVVYDLVFSICECMRVNVSVWVYVLCEFGGLEGSTG